jgi:hypothetical protein
MQFDIYGWIVFPTRFSLAEILVLTGGEIPRAVAFCTRFSARLKRVGNAVHP